MQIKAEGLPALLARAERERRMPALITVASDEALLAQEAQDAIRATARAVGYSEREVLQADARFDWSRLAQATQGLSLFAERRIVDLRLPTGKPGLAGAAALEALAQNLADDTLMMIALPRLDRRARETRWVECAGTRRHTARDRLRGPCTVAALDRRATRPPAAVGR